MMRVLIFMFVAVLLCCCVDGRDEATKVQGSETFRGAVYEHAVQDVIFNSQSPTRDEIWEALSVNIDPLTQAATDAKKQGADILVFPEYGVTGFMWENRKHIYPLLEDIPASDSGAIPCNSFPKHTIQNWLSCLAKEKKMYIAANVGDLKKCEATDPNCPADGAYQYNTNVVYDPNGMIVHRYHKINLYGFEVNFMNHGKVGQKNLVFSTPFGKMSSMVCFDIAFKNPGVPLASTGKIDTMLFLTAWMNKFPHFISIQFHSAWSTRHNVNLLSAEIHRRSMRMTGSGLYSPTGAVKYTYDTDTDKPKLLVSEMKIHPTRNVLKPGVKKIEFAEPEFTTKYYNFVTLTGTSGKVSVCKASICCQAEYKFSQGASSKELYALGASYVRSYHHKKGSLELCVILKCAEKTKDGCQKFVSDTSATFDSLVFRGSFSSSLVYPYVSLSGLKLAKKGQFSVSTIGEISTRVSGLPIVTMVLTGRNYDLKKISPAKPTTPSPNMV